MKKISVIVSLLLGTWQLHAQNWRPLQPGYVYQYDDPTGKYYSQRSGINYLKVTSKKIEDMDSVYYLNPVVLKVTPSSDYLTNYLAKNYPSGTIKAVMDHGLIVINKPYFLNKKVRMVWDEWIFEGNDTFVLKPSAAVGDTWNFSSSRSITAEVTGIQQGTVLGVADDIKTISLSSGDVIKLSRNHGIISFPVFDGNHKHYTLKGVEGPDLGIIVPRTKRIYDFQPGDVFQYDHKRSGNIGDAGEFITQVIIQQRNETPAAVSYKIREIKSKNGKVTLTSKTVSYEFEGNDLVNSYPGEVRSGNYEGEGHDYVYDSDLRRHGRRFQSGDYTSWVRINQSFFDTLYAFSLPNKSEVKSDFYTGLGMTYEYLRSMSGESETRMTAFRKTDGSSMGTLMAIDTTTGIEEFASHTPLGLQVYPNPASGETMNITGQIVQRLAEDETNQYFISSHNPAFLHSLLEAMPHDDVKIYYTTYENDQTMVKPLIQEDYDAIMSGNFHVMQQLEENLALRVVSE